MQNLSDEIKTHVDSGQVSLALESAKQLIKANPLDAGVRATMCALLYCLGDYDRARQQLAAHLKLEGESLDDSIDALLAAQESRKRVMTGEILPAFPGEIPSWAGRHREALRALAGGEQQPLVDSTEALRNALSSISGETQDLRFEGFCNADTRLAPVLEGVFEGAYTWLPMTELAVVMSPDKPVRIQDLLWIPCMITGRGGSWKVQGHLLATYPGTESADSEAAKLAMEVDWREEFDDVDVGVGQQILLAGAEALPILSLGVCRFDENEEGGGHGN